MNSEINIEYVDVIKAYQTKTTDLLTQLITAEARINASATYISNLQLKISELEKELQKYQKVTTSKAKKSSADEVVIDYNS